MRILPFVIMVMILVSASFADPANAQTDGSESIFNGKDLTGWSYLPTTKAQKKGRERWQKGDPNAPPWPIVETKVNFDGKEQSEDGRFVAEDGRLTVTVPEEGRKVQMLYSDVEVTGDFILKLEFRAANNADSGVFIRGRQLQCRDYPNAGPYKKLKKFKSEDWNELEVVVEGESARCTCNGEVLEEKFKVPAAGPIGVEGDRGKMEYRNIRIERTQSKSQNLLKPISDKAAWRFEQTADGKGSMKVNGDELIFDVTQTGDEVWHVQAFQAGLDLAEGAAYKVSFEIKAENDRSVVTLQAAINESDWHEIGLHEDISLSQEFEKQEFTFWATDVVKDKNRIGFMLGNQTGKVTVRKLMLQRLE